MAERGSAPGRTPRTGSRRRWASRRTRHTSPATTSTSRTASPSATAARSRVHGAAAGGQSRGRHGATGPDGPPVPLEAPWDSQGAGAGSDEPRRWLDRKWPPAGASARCGRVKRPVHLRSRRGLAPARAVLIATHHGLTGCSPSRAAISRTGSSGGMAAIADRVAAELGDGVRLGRPSNGSAPRPPRGGDGRDVAVTASRRSSPCPPRYGQDRFDPRSRRPRAPHPAHADRRRDEGRDDLRRRVVARRRAQRDLARPDSLASLTLDACAKAPRRASSP